MSATLWNIVVGLVTSVLSGGCVWLWQRARSARIVRRKAAFFGVRPGGTCLIIINNRWRGRGATEHDDVHALIDVATLAYELGARVSTKSRNDVRESNGDRTEFCIGGPHGGSNPRTGKYLATHLPGVTILPEMRGPDSEAFTVGDERFLFDRGNREYAIVAKFTPPTARRPVILICGHDSSTNRAAVHLLKRDYGKLMKTVASTERFCIVVRVDSIDVFGYEAVEFDSDVTALAFAPPAP